MTAGFFLLQILQKGGFGNIGGLLKFSLENFKPETLSKNKKLRGRPEPSSTQGQTRS